MTDPRHLTLSLRGHWYGSYGVAHCPVCQVEGLKHQNALTLAISCDGRLLAHCKRSGCSFKDILMAVGLIPDRYQRPRPAILAQRVEQNRALIEKKARQARRVWQETQPIDDTIAETYLWGRGITCPLPLNLRFHPAAWHGPTDKYLPAMIGIVDGSSGFSIHRTYLLPDGSGKAEVLPNKMMLGAVAGGAVRLSDRGSTLVVAEGIETALSLQSGLLSKSAEVWAALSSGNMASLNLPELPGHLTIAMDGDHAGQKAAHALAQRADALAWKVSLLPAPDGHDWNDILNQKGGAG